MSTKPLVGLSGRRSLGHVIGAPRGFFDSPLDVYMSDYATSVQQAGGIPVNIALDSVAEEIVDRLDALVFSGGDDVDPRRYGRAPGPQTHTIDPQRDQNELELFAAAMGKGIPVLGICRGAQLINIARGGTLIQHLEVGTGESHASYAYPRNHRAHPVNLEAGSIVASLYGASLTVNSFHHQAVDVPGDGVLVTGVAPDGVVEAFELANAPVMAVQWHPEVFGGDPIFGWLVTAAQNVVAQRAAGQPGVAGATGNTEQISEEAA